MQRKEVANPLSLFYFYSLLTSLVNIRFAPPCPAPYLYSMVAKIKADWKASKFSKVDWPATALVYFFWLPTIYRAFVWPVVDRAMCYLETADYSWVALFVAVHAV